MMQPTFDDATWHSTCNGGSCVQVAYRDGWVGLRDSKAGDEGPVLVFTADEWDSFVAAVKTGDFNGRDR